MFTYSRFFLCLIVNLRLAKRYLPVPILKSRIEPVGIFYVNNIIKIALRTR